MYDKVNSVAMVDIVDYFFCLVVETLGVAEVGESQGVFASAQLLY